MLNYPIKPIIVLVLAIALVLVLFSFEVIVWPFSSFRQIGNKGTIKVVDAGVYWDANCSSTVYSLDWGSVVPGSEKNITVFIRNEGNEPSTLFIATTNWNPQNASNFITLNWNYGGQTLTVNQTIPVKLTLSVSSSISGITNFTFDMIIGVNG